LREALSKLHTSKLVDLVPNKGYRVSKILDKKSMKEMLEARTLLETNSVRNAIRRYDTQSLVSTLTKINESMINLRLDGSYKDILEFNQLDYKFHYVLIDAGKNTFLSEAFEGMYCHLHIARFYHIRGDVDQEEATKEHLEIIDSIRTRDVCRSVEAITKHIIESGQRLLE
jgi:DNA-binding GntR family transcriptional regulator